MAAPVSSVVIPAGMDGQAPAGVTPAVHNSSLYVGDLDREVTEAQLFEIFSQIGPVASIRVCRDAVTRRSLGYAYVNYNSALDPQAAERALDTLNYAPLNGKPMRIMWSHRDPAFRKSGVGNIFIKNLDRSIDNKALHDTFSAFGNILSCKVAYDGAGQSKGYGFVHFEKEESAQLAIDKVNGMLLEGKKVYVGPFLKRTDRPADQEVRFTNVFVKNLADTVTEDQLMKEFGEYGPVTSAVIMRGEDGKSKGFGFVNFEEAEGAAAAVEALQGKEIEGKELYAGRAQKKAEREASLKQKFDDVRSERIAKYQGMNLYIKNLTDEVDDERLRNEFTPFGTITSAKVMRDPNGKSKGFGFVCFTLPEEATRSVSEMNGRMLMGKPMYVALAQRREVRRAQLEQAYTQRVAPVPARAGPTGPLPGLFPPGAVAAPMYYPGAGAMAQQRPGGNAGMIYGAPPMMARPMAQQGGNRGGRNQGGYPGPQQLPYQQQQVMGGPVRGGGRQAGRGRGRMDRGEMKGPGRGGFQGVQGRGGGRGNMPQPAPPTAPAPSAIVPGQEGGQLTTAMLAAAPPDAQKQMLGERLFPLVQRLQPELAGKITGMLLEMDNAELLLLLESSEALESKVDEAIQVLKQHNALPDGVAVEKE